MYDKWNLDVLYHGYDDPNFMKDMDQLKKLVQDFDDFAKQCDELDDITAIHQALDLLEAFQICAESVGSFLFLNQ